jgi:hypothetical protein
VHFGTYDVLLLGAGVLITVSGGYAVIALRGTDSRPVVEEAPQPAAATT